MDRAVVFPVSVWGGKGYGIDFWEIQNVDVER